MSPCVVAKCAQAMSVLVYWVYLCGMHTCGHMPMCLVGYVVHIHTQICFSVSVWPVYLPVRAFVVCVYTGVDMHMCVWQDLCLSCMCESLWLHTYMHSFIWSQSRPDLVRMPAC